MEENEVSNPEQFNNSGNSKKKKMGPVKGLLVAILIVFLIAILGLLIRMVVVGDGDFFKPIKDIFGIEGKKEEKETSNVATTGESPMKSGSRYALLSDEVNGENVKHYRLTIDMGEVFAKAMEELTTNSGVFENMSNDSSDDSFGTPEADLTFDDDENLPSADYYDDGYYGEGSSSNSMEDMLGGAMMLMQMMGDMIDGEMYIDIYFEGNEIIQIVVGYDYAKFAENMYNYLIEYDEDSAKEQGIESAEDFMELMNEQIIEMLDEDTIIEEIMKDEETQAQLKEAGFKEKDIRELLDFYCDTGMFEVYINGTTKLKGLLSMYLDSESCASELEAIEDETGIKIDEDNIIEEVLKAANETEEYSEMGLEFVEVK